MINPQGALLLKGHVYKHRVTGVSILSLGFMAWAGQGFVLENVTVADDDDPDAPTEATEVA